MSPYELYDAFDNAARETLARKLAFFDDLGVADLAILFDDMRGDSPDLAPHFRSVATARIGESYHRSG